MRLLRTKQVVELTGLSRMTIYRLEKSGAFPARRQLGANSVGWIDEDVSNWVENRPRPRRRVLTSEGAPPASAPLPPRSRPDPLRQRAAARRGRRRLAVQVDLPLGDGSAD